MNHFVHHILLTVVCAICFSLNSFAQSPRGTYNTYLNLVATCDSIHNDEDAETMYRHAHKTVLLAKSLKAGNYGFKSISEDSLAFYRTEGEYYMGRYYLHYGSSTDNNNYLQLAVNYFRLVIDQRNKMTRIPDLSEVYNDLALSYYKLNLPDSAVVIYSNNIDRCKERGNMRALAISYNGIGSVYLKRNDFLLAEINLLDALRIQQMIGDRTNIADTYLELGNLYMSKHDLDKAHSFFQKALQISADSHALSSLASALHASYIVARERNEITMALNYLEREIAVRDSLRLQDEYSDNTTRYQIQLQENKLEAIALQNEIDSLHLLIAENEKANTNRIALLLLHLLFFISAGFAIYYLYINRKNKRLVNGLQQQNKIIMKQAEELAQQRDRLTLQHESSFDSIRYASKIQMKIFGTNDIRDVFPLSFVFFKPKEVVSGDFFFVKQIGNCKVAAVADCTGHGMPAAFLSILCFNYLNEEVTANPLPHANEILENLRSRIKEALHTKNAGDTVLDGCDMGIAIFYEENNQIEFSGANIDLFIAKQRREDDPSTERDIEVLRATRNPLGWFLKEQSFKCYHTDLKPGDAVYMLSDGYKDQVGNDGAFGAIRTKKLLSRIANMTINEQRREVQSTFSSWMDAFEQTDDATLLGIKYHPATSEQS